MKDPKNPRLPIPPPPVHRRTVQARPAAPPVARPVIQRLQPPPLPTPARPAVLQPRLATPPVPPPRVVAPPPPAIQPMYSGLKQRSKQKGVNKTYRMRDERGMRSSPRIRSTLKAVAATPVVVINRPLVKMWDEKSRPSFREGTWTALLPTATSTQQFTYKNNTASVNMYKCPKCSALAYRRKELFAALGLASKSQQDKYTKSNPGEKFLSIDHKTNWKQYILSNAEPDDEGKITQAAALDAYNDQSNLVLMCNQCNSSKNGPKGVYD